MAGKGAALPALIAAPAVAVALPAAGALAVALPAAGALAVALAAAGALAAAPGQEVVPRWRLRHLPGQGLPVGWPRSPVQTPSAGRKAAALLVVFKLLLKLVQVQVVGIFLTADARSALRQPLEPQLQVEGPAKVAG